VQLPADQFHAAVSASPRIAKLAAVQLSVSSHDF